MSEFEIEKNAAGEIALIGRLDTAQAEKVQRFLAGLDAPFIIDFSRLEFISSSGLGVLLVAQKRVAKDGGVVKLVNMPGRIRDVFRYSGFDRIFDIEDPAG